MKQRTTTQSILKQLKSLADLPLDQASAMPPVMYRSDEIATLEQAQIFAQQWLCAGRSDAIPEVGDYLSHDIGTQPVVVIRQEDNSIRAFANVCRHRMMTLLEGSGHCKRKRINCPYHAWSYGIDGQLLGAPHMQDRPGFDKASYPLPPVRCEVWEGWIYVTLNPEIGPVATLLAELYPLVANYRMADYVHISQQDHVWDTNWKMLTENFMEGYHLPVTHRATVGKHFPVKDTRFSDKPPNPAFTYQYFTKNADAPVGNAHPDNTWLKGEQRRMSLMPTIFPTHMYVLAPDHLWYLSLQPQGRTQVRIRYGIALAPEVLAASDDPEGLKAEVIAFLDRVNDEDKDVVEGIFRGAQAGLSVAGPLCWLERSNHEFTQYIARRLCAELKDE